jgi:glycosyltransferase involved in cell wall biosynthesis
MIPITFMCNVKNEEKRISYVLAHATKWADEIVIIDRGSTDRTIEICNSFGSKLIRVIEVDGKKLAGDDDRKTWVNFSANDWIFYGTASEIPTPKCIATVKQMIDSDYDLITVPRKMYMLGVHSEFSPWKISNFKFLINRTRVNVSNKIHHNFSAKNGKEGHIPFSDDCCVYHLTYSSGISYMKAMTDYMQMEVAGSTNLDADIARCFLAIKQHDANLIAGGEETKLLRLAWMIYHLGTAFFLEEKRRGMDSDAAYTKIRNRLMEEWVGNEDH